MQNTTVELVNINLTERGREMFKEDIIQVTRMVTNGALLPDIIIKIDESIIRYFFRCDIYQIAGISR
jgi:hypothetical protein